MSDKKKLILEEALGLFADSGYNAVSTNKIAKAAGVSEGLIFRHFGSKKGLLKAITIDTEARINLLFTAILGEEHPNEAIKKFIELPFSIKKSEYHYWRLQYKLKWEKEFRNPNKMKPLENKLTACFKTLNFDQPKSEAILLINIIDAIAIKILQQGMTGQRAIKKLLLKKYKC